MPLSITDECDRLTAELMKFRKYAMPYAPSPPLIYRGMDRNLVVSRAITSWTKHFPKARWLARRFSKEGIVVAEYTDTLDVYTVVPNVVRSLTQEERFHCDFYRRRGEAEVLIANYQPNDRTRIVYDVMLKDIPLRGLTIAGWKQRLG
jgi:hypothetical protein